MIRWRPVPVECFAELDVAELEPGATNEELARAYRDALELARSRAALLESCRRFNAGEPAAPP